MTARRWGVTAVVGMLMGALVGVATPPPEPVRAAQVQQHPCDWVETCQYPCGGEADNCCQGEWNCPPDLTLPRC